MRPKQLARIGTFHLHEAVLDVLQNAYPDGHGMGGADISRCAGMYRKAGEKGMNDALVYGCLNELYEQGKVITKDQINGRGGWALSDDEYQRRRDDV